MRRTAIALVVASSLLLPAACRDDGDGGGDEGAAPVTAEATVTTTKTARPSTAFPCTDVSADAETVAASDLERMVLPSPGAGWEPDYLRGFYMDNREVLEVTEPIDDGCALMERTGRVAGYHGAYESAGEAVLTGVHLFADEAGAQAFLEARAGGEGWFRVGPVVGVVDAEDTASLVGRLRARIESVLAAPTTGVLSAAQLLSLPLPREALGDEYGEWPFDWFFGGLQANEERANNDADTDGERDDLARTGRLVSASGMWAPEGKPTRVYTTVSQHRDAAGAAAYLADYAGERGGGDAVEGVGDEAVLLREKGQGTTTTRLVFRVGALLGSIVDVRTDDADRRSWAEPLARQLEERIRALRPSALGGDAAGPLGPPARLAALGSPQTSMTIGTIIGRRRVRSLTNAPSARLA